MKYHSLALAVSTAALSLQSALAVDVETQRVCAVPKGASVFISEAGHSAAVTGTWDGKPHVLLDGKEVDLGLKGPEQVDVLFSPDATRVAYRIFDSRDAHASGLSSRGNFLIDGNRYGPFEDLGEVVFAPDGKRFAFVANPTQGGPKGDPTWLVDGQKPYGHGRDLTFSPDGKRVASIVGLGNSETVDVDGKLGTFPGYVSMFQFSPDSQHIAWYQNVVGGPHYFIDGKELDDHPTSLPAFSPDGTQTAYGIQLENPTRYFLLLNGQRIARESRIHQVLFSLDSRRMAIGVQKHDAGHYIRPYEAREMLFEEGWAYIVDGKEWPAGWGAMDGHFSADSRHFAYIINDKIAVIDGEQHPMPSRIRDLKLSPDGKHWACLGVKDAKWALVLDGNFIDVPVPVYPQMLRFHFEVSGALEYKTLDAGWILNVRCAP